jgi:uncharacterized protein GlcG (DUF336 family)
MVDRQLTRRSTRRDTLKFGSAAGLAVAASSVLVHQAAAQDATPAPGGNSRTIQTITLDAALQLIDAGQQKAMELGVPMAIAIVDSVGLLKAFHRMDGLDRAVTVDLVQNKAYTAASFQAPTHMLAESSNENAAFQNSVANIPNFTLIGGGYPITDGDVVIGGIGAGGGSPEQDMEVAEAALAALTG